MLSLAAAPHPAQAHFGDTCYHPFKPEASGPIGMTGFLATRRAFDAPLATPRPFLPVRRKTSRFRLQATKTWHKLILIDFERNRFNPTKRRQQ
jgi:hypothetical protein